MKRNYLPMALLVAAMLASAGCSGSQTGNANVTPAATPQPTPDRAAIEAELTKIENDWPRILKERDGAAVRKIEADDIVLVYPDGSDGSKDQDVKDIEAGALASSEQQITDLVVKVLDNDSAVVRLRITVKGDQYKISSGNCQQVIHEFRTVDTFSRRNGQWQIVASVSVPVMNPAPAATPSPTPPGPKASPSVKPSPMMKPSPLMKPSPAMKATPRPPAPKVVGSPLNMKTP